MSNAKALINKYIEFFTTKIKILYKEKTYKSNGNRVKYLLETNKDSSDLIVIFSGIPREGLKARYNYGRTLSKVKVNKLFILDDLAYDQSGGFYLGKDKDFHLEKNSIKLINKTKKDLGIKRTFYVGSSKGGFASLYFGLRDYESTIIAGAPTFYVGDYVSKGRFKKNTLPYIMGENYTDDDVEHLNALLKNVINDNNNNNNKIHLHYSPNDPRYKQDVQYLLRKLDENSIKYTEDQGDYTKHIDISLYFPSFLVETLNAELVQ